MTQNTTLRMASVMMVFAITSLAKAGESASLADLKVEKAALQKRLAEVNVQIEKLWVGRGVKFLGMTLVDPTQELMKQYGLSAEYPGPIIVRVQDPSFFPKGTAPQEGCSFWIVEHPAKAFFFNQDQSPTHFPKTVRELVAAIVACTVTPKEYQAIYDHTKKAAREYAEKMKDRPAERQRALKIADMKLADEEIGKYICRVVYNYPERKGTMTTQIYMTKADLDQLRELLKN